MHRLDELLHPGALVLLGEVHGTVEYPSFCAALLERATAVAPALEVRLALEISRTAQPLLDGFVDGRCSRSELVADPHWALPDGRGSTAMADLVTQVRALRARGARVEVLAVDVPRFDDPARPATELGATGFFAIYGDRDRAMADAVLGARRRSPEACTIALVGNWHSRCGTRAPHAMGYYLRSDVPGLVALHGVDAGGEAWVATRDGAGVHAVTGYRRPPAETVWWSRRLRPNGHHGWFDVGALTASPPAGLDASGRPVS